MKQLYGKDLCSLNGYIIEFEYKSLKECKENAIKSASQLGHKMSKFKFDSFRKIYNSYCECGKYIFIQKHENTFKVIQQTAYNWRTVRWCEKVDTYHVHRDRCFMVELNGRYKASTTRKFNLLKRNFGHKLSDKDIKKLMRLL